MQARLQKPEGLYVSEDYDANTQKKRKQLRAVVSAARSAELTAKMRFDKVVVKDDSGKTNIYRCDNDEGRVYAARETFRWDWSAEPSAGNGEEE